MQRKEGSRAARCSCRRPRLACSPAMPACCPALSSGLLLLLSSAATKNIDKNVHVLEKFLIHRVCFCPGKPETTHKFLYTPKALAVFLASQGNGLFPTSHRYIYRDVKRESGDAIVLRIAQIQRYIDVMGKNAKLRSSNLQPACPRLSCLLSCSLVRPAPC